MGEVATQHFAPQRAHLKRTICEVHREMSDILYDHYRDGQHYDTLMDKLQEAFTMAKKMQAKLRQYKYNYDEDWWEKTSKTVVQAKLRRRLKRSK